jgi:transcriptional regulator with XRE-family HTH domain
MAKQSVPAYPRYMRKTRALGERLRLARQRRRIPAIEMAERVGVSRGTLQSLERGDLSVGLGVLVRTLGVLGLDDDLDLLAQADELGHRLQDARAPRPRRTST